MDKDKNLTENLVTEERALTSGQVSKHLCRTSLPIMAGFVFYPAYLLIDTALLSKMEDGNNLIGFGLATMVIGLALESVGISLTSCVETLVSQAYGAEDYQLCRVYLNR